SAGAGDGGKGEEGGEQLSRGGGRRGLTAPPAPPSRRPEPHNHQKNADQTAEPRHYHNFIHDTKLKWADEDRLWIDKVRLVFWWWMNIYLENEAAPLYSELVKMVEAMDEDIWMDPETERRNWDLDDALDSATKQRGNKH